MKYLKEELSQEKIVKILTKVFSWHYHHLQNIEQQSFLEICFCTAPVPTMELDEQAKPFLFGDLECTGSFTQSQYKTHFFHIKILWELILFQTFIKCCLHYYRYFQTCCTTQSLWLQRGSSQALVWGLYRYDGHDSSWYLIHQTSFRGQTLSFTQVRVLLFWIVFIALDFVRDVSVFLQ